MKTCPACGKYSDTEASTCDCGYSLVDVSNGLVRRPLSRRLTDVIVGISNYHALLIVVATFLAALLVLMATGGPG